jgi:ABC-type uncharacterized transport system permease subunit
MPMSVDRWACARFTECRGRRIRFHCFYSSPFGVVTFCTMGNIVAAVVNSMQEAQLLTNLLYMPMLMLGGAAIPLAIMPQWVQTIAQFLPRPTS